jgi:hypothetical protein
MVAPPNLCPWAKEKGSAMASLNGGYTLARIEEKLHGLTFHHFHGSIAR